MFLLPLLFPLRRVDLSFLFLLGTNLPYDSDIFKSAVAGEDLTGNERSLV